MQYNGITRASIASSCVKRPLRPSPSHFRGIQCFFYLPSSKRSVHCLLVKRAPARRAPTRSDFRDLCAPCFSPGRARVPLRAALVLCVCSLWFGAACARVVCVWRERRPRSLQCFSPGRACVPLRAAFVLCVCALSLGAACTCDVCVWREACLV